MNGTKPCISDWLVFHADIMYNHSFIKRGLTRPANLQLVQGGYLERGMWPKGNIERQPSSGKPQEGFVMSDNVSLSKFIKAATGSASLAVEVGAF
jgi:hypothetical protein